MVVLGLKDGECACCRVNYKMKKSKRKFAYSLAKKRKNASLMYAF